VSNDGPPQEIIAIPAHSLLTLLGTYIITLFAGTYGTVPSFLLYINIFFFLLPIGLCRVSHPHPFHADPHPDPDQEFEISEDADPDLECVIFTDPDPDPGLDF